MIVEGEGISMVLCFCRRLAPFLVAMPSSARTCLALGCSMETRIVTSQFRPSIKCCWSVVSQAPGLGFGFFVGGAADEVENMMQRAKCAGRRTVRTIACVGMGVFV